MQFNPAFTVLFDACEPLLHEAENLPEHVKPPDALAELLDTAHRAHATEREVFEYALQGTKSLALLAPVVARVREGFARRLEGLHQLQAWLQHHQVACAVEGLLALEQGQAILAGSLPLISGIDSKTRFSPYPPLNDFIQAGLNVHGGSEAPQVLESRLPFVVSFVLSLEENWRDLAELDLVRPAEVARGYELIGSLQEAVGAVQVWLEEHAQGREASSNLLVGLHLLIDGSRQLHGLFAGFEGTFPPGSALPSIRRLSLRLAREEGGDTLRHDAFARVEMALRRLEAEVQDLDAAFLPLSIKEKFHASLAEALHLACEALEKVGEEEPAIADLERHARAFDEARDLLALEAQAAWPDLAGMPRFEQLRSTILGIYQGTVPTYYLRALEAAFSQGLEELASNTLAPEAREILALQQEGVEHLRSFLETGEREALVAGWFAIHQGLARTTSMSQEAADRERLATQAVLCVKCGHGSPAGSSHCEKCAAFLPFSKSMMAEVSDFAIAEGGGGGGTSSDEPQIPENIAKLIILVQQFRELHAVPEEFPGFIDTLLSFAAAAQKGTEKSLAAMAPEERPDGERFIALSARFEAGLLQMRAALSGADEEGLMAGLEAVLAAATELVQFQRPREAAAT